MSENRYDIENIPIRDELREELKGQKLIEVPVVNVLQAIGRMQGRQDDYIEELIDKVIKEIKLLRKDINKRYEKIEERVAKLEEKVA